MRHKIRHVSPMGLRLSGLARGFGGAFDLPPTFDPGGDVLSQSVQQSEMAVTGTFAARAPTLLDADSAYQTQGMVKPSVRYSDGTVITSDGRHQKAPPSGWSPDPRTWGSPMDALTGSTKTASNQVEDARQDNLDPGVIDAPHGTGEAIDGTWDVASNGALVHNGNGNGVPRNGNGNGAASGGMKWWHWALIGGAVLGGGYALTRVFAR